MINLDGWTIPGWALDAKPSMKKIYRISDDEFIIFKNVNDEVDWMLSDQFDKNCADDVRSYIDNIYSKITFLLSYLPKDINTDVVENIHTMCSEALAAIFNKNTTLSTDIVNSIEERIAAYKYQKYIGFVYKTVGSTFALLSIVILVMCLINLKIPQQYQFIPSTVIAFSIGGLGSISSILFTKKEVNFKEILENESVIDDVRYKILLGSIFACISYAMISSNIIEPFKDFNFHQSIIIFFLCGFSERFAPSIFENFNKT